MRNKANQVNIDNSDLFNYPNGRIRNNDGSGNGTPVDESVYGDLHETKDKIMRDSKTTYNNLPDNQTNGYQLYEALMSLGGKNDMIKTITKINDTTLLIPVKIEALKEDESIIFQSNFASTNAMVSIRGSDNISKNLTILGGFQSGQKVRLINKSSAINIVGLYDSEVLPNLINNIATINATFANLTKILAVFIPGGTMMFWNKPANQIPTGWQEVVNWRGRFPVGMDVSQLDFQVLGGVGGEKRTTLSPGQLPKLTGQFETTAGQGANPSGVFSQPYAASASIGGVSVPFKHAGVKLDIGNDESHNNLPPYRTVLFIEYIG